MQTLGIIPSRFASTRFPGKPLVLIDGKTMIQRVYMQACKAQSLAKVVVATDDERIFKHVQSFGGQVVMTDKNHQSGTDRCAEVALNFQDMEAIINIQGDEPFINPLQIDQVAQQLEQNTVLNIATLAKKITNSTQLFSPNIVKVVFNSHHIAHYFSRSPIPFLRGVDQNKYHFIGDYSIACKYFGKIRIFGAAKMVRKWVCYWDWLDGYRNGGD